jgi:hypothetical protein
VCCVHPEHTAGFPHHGCEQSLGGRLTRDQRRHTPQRGLLLRGVAALGHVAARDIEEAFLRHDARAPLHPAQRAVATDDSILQLHDIGTALERRGSLQHPLTIVRVGELNPRPRQQLLARVAEHVERRVEPRQVTVEARQGQQSRRHLEDPLGLALRSQQTAVRPIGRERVVHACAQLLPGASKGARRHDLVEPATSDRHSIPRISSASHAISEPGRWSTAMNGSTGEVVRLQRPDYGCRSAPARVRTPCG